MLDLYILKYRKPVVCPDLIKWGKQFERKRRRVRFTILHKDLEVSTVFLGVNYSWDDGLELFETCIIDHGEFEIVDRCDTWRHALKMHWKAVDDLRTRVLD
jgi:hypothetical protein